MTHRADYMRCHCADCAERRRVYMREYRQRPDVKARNALRARTNRQQWDSYYYRPTTVEGRRSK